LRARTSQRLVPTNKFAAADAYFERNSGGVCLFNRGRAKFLSQRAARSGYIGGGFQRFAA
jgi:hypothetical protein